MRRFYQSLIAFLKKSQQSLSIHLKPYQDRISAIWRSLSVRAKLTVMFGGLILAMTLFFYFFAVYQTMREIKIGAVTRGQAVAEALKDEVTYALQNGTPGSLNFTFR